MSTHTEQKASTNSRNMLLGKGRRMEVDESFRDGAPSRDRTEPAGIRFDELRARHFRSHIRLPNALPKCNDGSDKHCIGSHSSTRV